MFIVSTQILIDIMKLLIYLNHIIPNELNNDYVQFPSLLQVLEGRLSHQFGYCYLQQFMVF